MKRIITTLTILLAFTANGQWPPERAFPENYPSLRVGDSIYMPFLKSATDTVVHVQLPGSDNVIAIPKSAFEQGAEGLQANTEVDNSTDQGLNLTKNEDNDFINFNDNPGGSSRMWGDGQYLNWNFTEQALILRDEGSPGPPHSTLTFGTNSSSPNGGLIGSRLGRVELSTEGTAAGQFGSGMSIYMGDDYNCNSCGISIAGDNNILIDLNFSDDNSRFKYSEDLSSSFTEPNEIPSIGHVRSNISDTADVLRDEFTTADNLKLNIADTAAMLNSYPLRSELLDTTKNIRTTIGSKQNEDELLNAISGLTANGFMVRTSSSTVEARTIAVSNDLEITNGDGVLGDPEIGISTTFKDSKLNVSDTADMLSTYANFSHDATVNNYTLTDADFGKLITNITANSDTIIIPTDLTTGNNFISRIDFENYDVGNIVIEAAPTVSLNGVAENSLTIADQFAGALLRKIGDNEYVLIGSYE